VDQLARHVALITTDRLAVGGPISLIQTTLPSRVQDVCTVDAARPTSKAMLSAPHGRLRRRRSTLRPIWRGVRFGHRCGRDDRSSSSASPSMTYRFATCSPSGIDLELGQRRTSLYPHHGRLRRQSPPLLDNQHSPTTP
jgi:hypothetical protein